MVLLIWHPILQIFIQIEYAWIFERKKGLQTLIFFFKLRLEIVNHFIFIL